MSAILDPDRDANAGADPPRSRDDKPRSDSDHFDVIDVDAARARIPGGMESVRELAELMIDECARIVTQIHRAISDRDAETLRRGAHTLRGSAGVFAAQPVVDVARRLEDLGRSTKIGRAGALLPTLDRETDRLIVALRSLLASGSSDE